MKSFAIKNIINFFFALCLVSCSTGYAETHDLVIDCDLSSFQEFSENCQIVNKINKNSHKFRKLKKDILEGSTEGGSLEAFLDHGEMKKISVSNFGEMGQRNLDIFFKNKRPIFFSEEIINYDRPIYIEGFQEKSKIQSYYFFKDGFIFKFTTEVKEQPKIIPPEVERSLREQIEDYIELVDSAKGGS